MAASKPVNQQTAGKILKWLQAGETQHMRRMYLLFATGLYTGFRVSDLVGLRVQDISGSHMTVTEQKTGKQRTITIHKELRKIFAERLQGKDPGEYIFDSRKKGRDGQRQHITTRCAFYDFKQIQKQFALKDFSCHSARKTFAMAIYNRPPSKGGKDLARVARALNHSSPQYTLRYLGLQQKQLDEDVNSLDFMFTADGKPKRGRPRKQ